MQLLLLLLLEGTKTERCRGGQGWISSNPMSSRRANGRRWNGFRVENAIGCRTRSVRHTDDRWMGIVARTVRYPGSLGSCHIWWTPMHRNGRRALDRWLEGTRGWLLRALRLERQAARGLLARCCTLARRTLAQSARKRGGGRPWRCRGSRMQAKWRGRLF